jgi:signal transduction histidine kinase
MASRLSHELRTPIAVVRSSLDNLNAASLPDDARVYMARAREGIARLTQILTRMTEAARLEQSLSDVAREPFALDEVVASCVAGFRVALPGGEHRVHDTHRTRDRGGLARPRGADARQAPRQCGRVRGRRGNRRRGRARGRQRRPYGRQRRPLLPADMQGRLFESMVSVRAGSGSTGPHLGLGLYIVRVIASSIAAPRLRETAPTAAAWWLR